MMHHHIDTYTMLSNEWVINNDEQMILHTICIINKTNDINLLCRRCNQRAHQINGMMSSHDYIIYCHQRCYLMMINDIGHTSYRVD
jgi:hypothetical protein